MWHRLCREENANERADRKEVLAPQERTVTRVLRNTIRSLKRGRMHAQRIKYKEMLNTLNARYKEINIEHK